MKKLTSKVIQSLEYSDCIEDTTPKPKKPKTPKPLF